LHFNTYLHTCISCVGIHTKTILMILIRDSKFSVISILSHAFPVSQLYSKFVLGVSMKGYLRMRINILVVLQVGCMYWCLFVWWRLTPISTIFQLYLGGQFYLWRKPVGSDFYFIVLHCKAYLHTIWLAPNKNIVHENPIWKTF
jgi:hypothetical protein